MKKADTKTTPSQLNRKDKIIIGLFLSSIVLIILPYDVCVGNSAEFFSRFLKASLLSLFSLILLIRFWKKKCFSELKYRKTRRLLSITTFIFIIFFNVRALFLALLIYPYGQYTMYENVANSYDKVIYRFYRHFPVSSGDWKARRVYRHDFFPLISIEKEHKSKDLNGVWKFYGYPYENGEYKRTVLFKNGEVIEILDSAKVNTQN